MTVTNDEILLVLPVPVIADGGELFIEGQAAHGLELWAENFKAVTYAASVTDRSAIANSVELRPHSSLKNRDRIRLVPLPGGGGLSGFVKDYKPTRALLKELIETHQYLSFGVYWHAGDWPAVAALEALKQGRKYSVWKDIVDHEAHLRLAKDMAFLPGLKARADAEVVKRYHHYLISRASLGLFHGADCLRAYSPICAESHLVHDITLTEDDQIGAAALAEKIARAREGGPIRLVYAGRVAPPKGPRHWIDILKELAKRGVAFEAAWYGDGPLLEECRSRIAAEGLAGKVEFYGFMGDRQELLRRMRAADLFLFCHTTPESPRCLIEALKSGLPLVGFESAYVSDLTAEAGGGAYYEIGDVHGVADEVASLAGDREALAKRIGEAAQSGEVLCDTAVFRHRSELIRAHS